MEEARPIHEVFLPLARQVAKAMQGRVGRMQDVHDNEPFTVSEKSNDDGTTTLLYSRTHVHDGAVEFKNIASAGIGDTTIGDETITHSDTLGSNEEDVYSAVSDVEVDFADTFQESDSEADTSSEGTSLKVSAEGEGGVEGFGSFKSSVEAEAHAEFTQSEGHETSRGSEGDNETTIPKGVHAKIIETRSRADGVATATTTGKFSFVIGAGHHSGGHFVSYHHGVGHVYFKSWTQYVDVIKLEAPNNWPLANAFIEHPMAPKDREKATKVLDGRLRYTLAFTGRVKRDYQVLTLQPDGTYK